MKLNANWGLPLFSALCGFALILEGQRLPLFKQYSGIGAGFMPFAIGLCLLGVALALSFQAFRGVEFSPEEAEGADANAPVNLEKILFASLSVLTPIITFPFLGFPLGGAMSFALVCRAFGSTQILKDLAIGVVLSGLTYFFFVKLGVQLGGLFPLLGVK
jgi:putative tricarboxylic transport membrane protein